MDLGGHRPAPPGRRTRHGDSPSPTFPQRSTYGHRPAPELHSFWRGVYVQTFHFFTTEALQHAQAHGHDSFAQTCMRFHPQPSDRPHPAPAAVALSTASSSPTWPHGTDIADNDTALKASFCKTLANTLTRACSQTGSSRLPAHRPAERAPSSHPAHGPGGASTPGALKTRRRVHFGGTCVQFTIRSPGGARISRSNFEAAC